MHHDVVLSRVRQRVKDRRVVTVSHRFLNAGVRTREGRVELTAEGTPPGGPLSPRLANLWLDELDQELEERGHRFARDADDAHISGRRRQAGERVMASVARVLERTRRLTVNIYKVAQLREAYYVLQRQATPGIDGVTWQHYGQDLEANLQDLSKRLARGASRATAVRRAYIPKPDGRQRPLGVPAWIFSVIWEEEFRGFSYGCRPGRSPHHALDALMVGIHRKRVNWILDADIQGFFDHVSHAWLVQFVEYRIGDKRVVRLIQQWQKAGVLVEGRWT